MPSFRLSCPRCGRPLTADSIDIGHRILCPACGTRVLVPAPAPRPGSADAASPRPLAPQPPPPSATVDPISTPSPSAHRWLPIAVGICVVAIVAAVTFVLYRPAAPPQSPPPRVASAPHAGPATTLVAI